MPTPARTTQACRIRDGKKGIDAAESKQKRHECKFEFSKTRRDESLQKRRSFRQEQEQPEDDESLTAHTNAGVDQIAMLVPKVHSTDTTVLLEATTAFRKILSMKRSPPIDEVVAAGVVPRMVQLLARDDSPQLQFEAAWALTNVASGTSAHTQTVVEAGAIPHLVRLVLSPFDEVREQAIWALGNIAGDSPQLRDAVLQAGAIPPCIQLLGQGNMKITMLRNCTWSLSNFCRGKPQPSLDLVLPVLPMLAALCNSDDEEVLTDACWGMSYLSDGTNDKIQAVLESNVVPRLIQLLGHPADTVKTPALRCVGNIVTGSDSQTQAALDYGALQMLLPLLTSTKKSIRKEVCWTISNVTAGSKEQIQTVINAHAIPPIIALLSAPEFEVRKEAAWAISNATSGGTKEQIHYMVQQGCLSPLCELLNVQDARIVIVALEGLENILRHGEGYRQMGESNPYTDSIEEADGVRLIEELQHHANEKIYESAVRILETYFEGEDEDHGDLAPRDDGRAFSFGVPRAPIAVGGLDFSGGFD